ncbi:sulfotransferase domain-containing protein [Carboxylicivirga linearis]|uniref:Sulfotransferase domain-containing protein n=1 Tax=Carboxylicivirga linearis TaxID=1628157 RepID=A0ABS5JUP8_9BACT|nr:sulfotransferase domain-containing protein [Carboxylicivirga linearis]MBS2098548.1 sulfotransferase domain-containing protein [Carboxylicivirga linearis]
MIETYLRKYGNYLNKLYNRKHIFISSFPKSGSTFLHNYLKEVTGFQESFYIKSFDQTEQDIYLPNLISSIKKNTVTYQHCRATKSNINTLNFFNIKPIVLTRSIHSCITSLYTHMEIEPENTWWPMAFIGQDYYQKSEQEKLDFIIDMFTPWYLNFYVSWKEYEKNNNSILWLDYSAIKKENIESTLEQIISYYKINNHVIDKNKNIDCYDKIKLNSRFRGDIKKMTLDNNQNDRIQGFLNHYPSTDFDSIL